MFSRMFSPGNPAGHMHAYLAGTGNLLLTGAVAFNLALSASRVELGLAVWVIAIFAALVTGCQGTAAMLRFASSASRPATAIALGTATGFFALLAGGLLGVVATSMIGRILQVALR